MFMEEIDPRASAIRALQRFKLDRLLNQGRRVSLLGTIDGTRGIVNIERAAFAVEDEQLRALIGLNNVENLGTNDIYSWFMGRSSNVQNDLKLNLIWPCTEKHITKYSAQRLRSVTETPQVYRQHVRPYMLKSQADGQLNWVYDILEGRAEQTDVMYRTPSDDEYEDEGFVLLPDLNWDRKTISTLHCLALCERRDILSLRDLKKQHVPWLKRMRQGLLACVARLYALEADQIKLYVHYQPTYYHFHVHVVNVLSDPGTTQAVGKAVSYDSIVDQLERMTDDDAGMADVSLTYVLGEASQLWLQVFEPLKRA